MRQPNSSRTGSDNPPAIQLPWFSRIRWGVRWGLVYALIYSIIALVVGLFSGGSVFAWRQTSLGGLLAAYALSGVVVGTVVGILLPLARWKVGAAIIGMIGTIPYMSLVRGSIPGLGPWSLVDTVTVAVLTIFFGIPAGLICREIFWSDEPHTEDKERST